MTRLLLIYDGDCSYCRTFARTLQWLDRRDRIAILPYDAPEAQRLLRAQFDEEIGFTLYLFTPERVLWAGSAARGAVQALGLPRPLGWLAFVLYPAVVRAVSRLSGRRRAVCLPGQAACQTRLRDEGAAPLRPAARALWAAEPDQRSG